MEKKIQKDSGKRTLNSSQFPSCTSKVLVSSFYEDPQRNISPQVCRDYEITNQNKRIIKRIICPRRDKVIQNSLYMIRNKQKLTHKRSAGTIHRNSSIGKKEKNNEFRILTQQKERKSNKKEKDQESQKKYRLKLENERMGERIVNVKSYFAHQQNISQFGQKKLNKGVKVFFRNASSNLSRQIRQESPISNFRHHYGFGPTIILISNIRIQKNPPLKEDDLICIQMLNKSKFSDKFITEGIRYDDLQNAQIKFAVRLRQIGQFVPLKFSKICGVDLQEIGLVDIDFTGYLYNINSKENDSFVGSMTKQQNNQGKTRYIFSRQITGRMRGSKFGCIRGQINIEYKIYSKKYR